MFEKEHKGFSPEKKITKNGILINKKKCNHLLTHQKISAVFWHFLFDEMPIDKTVEIVKISSLSKYPVPKIVENYIKENILIEV